MAGKPAAIMGTTKPQKCSGMMPGRRVRKKAPEKPGIGGN